MFLMKIFLILAMMMSFYAAFWVKRMSYTGCIFLAKKILKYLLTILAGIMVFYTACWTISYFQSQPDVTFVGVVKRADGIGGQIFDHQKVLDHAGAKVNVRSTRFSFAGLPWRQVVQRFWQRINPFPVMGKVVVYEGVLSPLTRENPLRLEKIFRSPMWNFQRRDHILVAYSMFESSKIPEIWVKTFNEKFDAVAVPDPFLVDVYKKSGVHIPVFVLPLGVHYGSLLKEPLKQSTQKPFVFSNLAVINDRKNTLKTIQAFVQAFGQNPNVRLVINGREYHKSYLQECQDFLRQSGVSNVFLTTNKLSRKDFIDMLKNSDCYISLSKGEGFSIIPREAMALGIPVIVTDNTGQSTIARSGWVKPVSSPIQVPAKYYLSKKVLIEGVNYDFHIQDAVQAMQDVFNHHQKYLSVNADARAWAMKYAYTNKDLQDFYVRLFFDPKKCVLGHNDAIHKDYLEFDQNNAASVNLYHKYVDFLSGKESNHQCKTKR
jgi:glycosyltransferase involved in cell wall biosynthesis